MRLRFPQAAAVGLVLAALVSCGSTANASGRTDPASTGATPAVIDLGPLRGARLFVGTTDTDVVPVVRTPLDGAPTGPVFSIDLSSGTIADLGRLPTSKFVANGYAVTVDDHTVLSADLCDQPPTVGEDAGFDCPSGSLTWQVFVHHDERWSAVGDGGVEPATFPPNVTVIEGVVDLVPTQPDQPTVTLDLATLTTRPAPAPAQSARCEFSGDDGAVIDLAAGAVRYQAEPGAQPATAHLADLPVPFSSLAGAPFGLAQCWSSGPYLAMADSTVNGPSPVTTTARPARGSVTTTTASAGGDSSPNAVTASSATSLIDLRHPARRPLRLDTDGRSCCLISGDGYWGWQSSAGLVHLRSPGGAVIADVRRSLGATVATRHAVGLLDSSTEGAAQSLRVLRIH